MALPPFQSLYDRCRDDVYRFLVALVGPQEADDCFQETFLAALRAYPRLRAASNVRAWMITIAYRKAMDAHRTRRRTAVPVPAVPDRASAAAARDGEVWDSVRELPPKQRAAVVCRYVGDLPYREIARVVGCSEAAARQNVRTALQSLRERWRP